MDVLRDQQSGAVLWTFAVDIDKMSIKECLKGVRKSHLLNIKRGHQNDVLRRCCKNFHSGSSRVVFGMSDNDVEMMLFVRVFV